MPVSPYFQHVDCKCEQDLFHELAREFVYLAGISVLYIRVKQSDDENFDELFWENRFEVFQSENAKEIEMWINNPEQPLDNADLMAKFGFSQPNSSTYICETRRFNELFGHRPREGDYIFVPKWESFGPEDIFRITKVDVADYQLQALGSPVYFFIHTERARFNHQTIENNSINIHNISEKLFGEIKQGKEVQKDNEHIEESGKDCIEFDENNPFGMP